MPGGKTPMVTPKPDPAQQIPGGPNRASTDTAALENELKRQTEQRRDHEKPAVNADRPRDRRLKPERKGVI